jgi:L-alanine-DL-glutamate epimerase-like enolase superfamily enzyme
MIADAIRHLTPWIIGEGSHDINAMWHRIFRKAAYPGPRGLPTAVVSCLDIALWDIKGKVTGRPIYDLFGGKVRPSIPISANGWFSRLVIASRRLPPPKSTPYRRSGLSSTGTPS